LHPTSLYYFAFFIAFLLFATNPTALEKKFGTRETACVVVFFGGFHTRLSSKPSFTRTQGFFQLLPITFFLLRSLESQPHLLKDYYCRHLGSLFPAI
jgi:hypothetical protein